MRAPLIAAILSMPLPAAADDVTDALSAAIVAYQEGAISDALGELAYATQLLNTLQAQGLADFLPAALDGWTRVVDDDVSASLGFMGGGTAASATYQGPTGQFTITMMADNPMVASMGAMLGNATIMSTMGQIVRINRENFLSADGDISGLIGNRVLIQAEDGEEADMIAHLEQLDFDALEDFDD